MAVAHLQTVITKAPLGRCRWIQAAFVAQRPRFPCFPSANLLLNEKTHAHDSVWHGSTPGGHVQHPEHTRYPTKCLQPKKIRLSCDTLDMHRQDIHILSLGYNSTHICAVLGSTGWMPGSCPHCQCSEILCNLVTCDMSLRLHSGQLLYPTYASCRVAYSPCCASTWPSGRQPFESQLSTGAPCMRSPPPHRSCEDSAPSTQIFVKK